MVNLLIQLTLVPRFVKVPFLVLHFSCLYINDFPDDVFCNISVYMLMILLSTISGFWFLHYLYCSNFLQKIRANGLICFMKFLCPDVVLFPLTYDINSVNSKN